MQREKLIEEMTSHELWPDFQEWATLNPEVVTEIIARAREAKASGRDRYSLKVILERVRWEMTVIRGMEEWSVNNSFAPLLSRLVMVLAPDLGNLFELRKIKQRINATPDAIINHRETKS